MHATLRQSIKFADRATHSKAVALQKNNVRWRSIPYWLGVKDQKGFNRLYRKMVGGLTNSTEIRRYIAETFDKQARPRVSTDIKKSCTKSRATAERLVAMLGEFDRAYQRHQESTTPQKRKTVRQELLELSAALKKASQAVVRTRAKIRN